MSNTGESAASSLGASVSGTQWAISGTTCGGVIAASDSCTFTVQFTSPGAGAAATGTFTLGYYDSAAGQAVQQALSGTGVAASVTVGPAYSSAPNWNDYVPRSNGAQSLFTQADASCSGAEGGKTLACFHAGEIRKVQLAGVPSCAGLVIGDNLGAFRWTCIDSSGTATFYSQGFRPGMGLADLISSLAWRAMKVTITKGAYVVGESVLSGWWGNTIVAAPSTAAAAQVLGVAGTIYVLSADVTGNYYYINADKVALVLARGITLTNNATLRTALVDATGRKYLWIEGAFDGNVLASYPIYLNGTHFSRVHRAEVRRAKHSGIYLTSSSYNVLTDVDAYNNGTTNFSESGINASQSTYNIFSDIRIARGVYGFYLQLTSTNNVVHRLISSNNPQYGIKVHGSNSNIFTSVLSVANSFDGIGLESVTGITIHSTTVANNMGSGVGSWFNGNGNFTQLMALNNDDGNGAGLFLNSASNNLAYNIVSVANQAGSARPILLNFSDNNFFKGYVGVGAGETCAASGINSGLDTSCAGTGGGSNAFALTGLNAAGIIFGKAVSDATNATATAGMANFASLIDGVNDLDWLRFDSLLFRSFGRDGSVFPNSDQRGACTGGICRIWDWRLSASATSVLNRSNDLVSINPPYTDGAACPVTVHGNYATSDALSNTYLVNATEIVLDGFGDEDGLCESNERCLYSPNVGAYQGEGNFEAHPCTFQNGTVTGVTMYRFDLNGV